MTLSQPSQLSPPQELSRIVDEPNMQPLIKKWFPPSSVSTAIIHHYAYVSASIDVLERELERHQLEREEIYNCLVENRRFRRRIAPILKEF